MRPERNTKVSEQTRKGRARIVLWCNGSTTDFGSAS